MRRPRKKKKMAKKVRILLALAAVYLVFCSLAVCTRAEVEEEEEAADEQSYVLTLDASNLTETVAKHDFIVVEFYAPWCGHCQQLAPEYEKAAAVLAEHDPPIVLAKLDGNEEKNKAVLSEYNIGGFPSLKVFKNKGSVVTDYKGPREADGIVEHLKKLLQPPSLEIKSSDDVAKFDDEKVYVIGVFPEFSGEEFENFIQVAEKLRSDYDFGHTKDAKLLTKGDTEIKGPSARLFKPYDELHADTKDFKPESLEKFIEDLSKPLVTVLTKDPATHPMVIKYFNLDNTKALLFVNFSTENIEAYRSEFHAASKVGKEGEIIFLLGDLEASDGAFEFFGLSLDLAPLILINGKNGKKFYKGNVKADEIIPYIKDYLAGKLTPFIKSAPIPETNDEPVKVVVTHSIQDMFYSGKNVLLEFYAPWCGHCKSLAPILEEAAIALKDDPEVVIAKLDATANDVPPEFEVPGYPTLYFRSASGKIVKYESGRSKEDIIEFINKNRDPPAVSAASATIESKVSDQEAEPVKDEL